MFLSRTTGLSQFWEQELESLHFVIEMKNERIHELDKRLILMETVVRGWQWLEWRDGEGGWGGSSCASTLAFPQSVQGVGTDYTLRKASAWSYTSLTSAHAGPWSHWAGSGPSSGSFSSWFVLFDH